MKYTVLKDRACSSIWKDKSGARWPYMPADKAKEQNISHRDILGDVPPKHKAAIVGKLYGEDESQSCPVVKYREKLKYSEKFKGVIPCQSEGGETGYVRVIGTAWTKVLLPLFIALILLTGVGVAVWHFTKESGPPLDEAAIAYQMPNGVKNNDPTKIMLPGFGTLTMDAQTGQIQAALVNPEGNPCYFKYIISMADTKEELYRSGWLEPGTAVTEFTIEKDLEPGTYDIQVTVETGLLDDYTQPMNNGVIASKLEVKEE